MIREFYDLEVWKKGKELVLMIYQISGAFPKRETYSLSDQLRRAAISICANIAEGFERYYPKDKIRFYHHARGSLSECKSHIIIAKELRYVDDKTSIKLLDDLDLVGKMLNSLITSLSRFIKS